MTNPSIPSGTNAQFQQPFSPAAPPGAATGRSRLKPVLAWAAALLAVTGAVLGWGFARFGSVTMTLRYLNGERIFVGPSLIDCGDGKPGEVRESTVSLRNESSDDINVIGCESSCCCVAAGEFPVWIPGGASHDFPVKVAYGPSAGTFEYELRFLTDSKDLPAFRVVVRARVTADAEEGVQK